MEGLETISEDEQLRRLLEMSRLESGSPESGGWRGLRGSHSPSPPSPMGGVGSPIGRTSSFGRASPRGRGNPSLASPSTPPRGGRGFRTAGDLDLEEWRAMSVEERHLLLNGQVEEGCQAANAFVRPQTNRPPPPPQHLVSLESSENSDEEEDEILKSILEQSKKETRMTEEEKTNLVLLESLKEVNVIDKSVRESKEERKMRELMEKEEGEKVEKRIKLEDENMTDDDQKKREREELERAIKESLGLGIGDCQNDLEKENISVDMGPPPPPAFSGTPPPSPARPTSLPGPVRTQLDLESNMDASGSKVVQKSEINLGAVPRRKHTLIPNPPIQNPILPALNNPDFPPTLGDEEAQLAWALEASKPQARPSSPKIDGATGGIPDEDEQLAWALQASQPEEPPKSRHNSGSAGPDLISVLTPEEQMELALRLSQPSRTPTAIGSNSPLRSSSAHRTQPAPSSSPHRMSPDPQPKPEGLRLIVIDGCNVAMAHGLHRTFSVKGLVLAYEHFREKGHQVAIFLPRKSWTYASPEDQAILTALEQTEILFLVQNLAYDDKMIIRYAEQKKGVILSNDRYRDVMETNPELNDQIKNRTLKFTWVHDTLMIAEDPFGRYGPSLHQLLRF